MQRRLRLRRRGSDDIVKTLGIEGISRSQVSRVAKTRDATVEAFRSRPLDAGPYTYLWLDALTQKVREGGRMVNVACVIATDVNANGSREVLGIDVITTEDGAGWLAFLRSLVARGLSGVQLVVSDAHQGLTRLRSPTSPERCVQRGGWRTNPSSSGWTPRTPCRSWRRGSPRG